MTTLSHALALASKGFHVFPIQKNGSTPVITDFPNRATRDEYQIRKWFEGKEDNIGISTTRFGDDQALIVIDVDVKKGKHGEESLLALELNGLDLPATVENSTPSGGRHLIYVNDLPCKQGVDVLGEGLDIRSRGGYILGPGSTRDGLGYLQINGHGTLAQAPQWLVDRLGLDTTERVTREPLPGVDPLRAQERAAQYLKTAPIAREGEGGDLTTYKVAARVKDFGCDLDTTFELMFDHWNPRCEPPWEDLELSDKVAHAFKYGADAPGSAAPEAVFPAVEAPEAPAGRHPLERLNDEYAFVKKGCFILQQTTDDFDRPIVEQYSPSDIHSWHANRTFQVGSSKPRPISQCWMEWAGRREYDALVFNPSGKVSPRFFNLWRGFTVEPADTHRHPAVDQFLDHVTNNICNGDTDLAYWLLGWVAHMIQKPHIKPLVALVLKGGKGTGKNAFTDIIGHLVGAHYLLAADDRYLLSNFNSHFEANLLFVLDEATWAGDKKADGKLKHLITGKYHLIERKGREPYQMANLSRVIINTNSDWAIPASTDERRFGVFELGNKRQGDRDYFRTMREGMEAGGYAHLLRFLLDFDLSTVDVDDAPKTLALMEQKVASLSPIEMWIQDCLVNDQVMGGDFGGEWPKSVPTDRFRNAYIRWVKDNGMGKWRENDVAFGKIIAKVLPSLRRKKLSKSQQKSTTYGFFTPGLDQLRADFERYMGGAITWPE